MEDTRIDERVDSPLGYEGWRNTGLHWGDGNDDVQPRKGLYSLDCVVRHSRCHRLLLASPYRRYVRMDADTESEGQGCRWGRDQQAILRQHRSKFQGQATGVQRGSQYTDR